MGGRRRGRWGGGGGEGGEGGEGGGERVARVVVLGQLLLWAVGVFGAVWVVLRVAGRARCGRVWGGVGVWGVWVVAGSRGE